MPYSRIREPEYELDEIVIDNFCNKSAQQKTAEIPFAQMVSATLAISPFIQIRRWVEEQVCMPYGAYVDTYAEKLHHKRNSLLLSAVFTQLYELFLKEQNAETETNSITIEMVIRVLEAWGEKLADEKNKETDSDFPLSAGGRKHPESESAALTRRLARAEDIQDCILDCINMLYDYLSKTL